EDEMLDPGLLAALQQIPGRAGVVAVVLERIRDRLRHDRVRREMHDRLDAVLAKHVGYELAISRIAHDERCSQDRRAKAGGQVIEDDDGFVALAKLANDVTTDVASAACDENAHVGFRSENGGRKSERLAWIGPF